MKEDPDKPRKLKTKNPEEEEEEESPAASPVTDVR